MMRTEPRVRLVLCVLVAAHVALAQRPAGAPPATTPTTPGQLGQPQEPAVIRGRDPLDPNWVAPKPVRPFAGFPTFPSRLQGLGAYTQPAGTPTQNPLQALLPMPVPLLPAAEEENGWPAWARTRDKAPLPFAADLALLVRHGDRVWFTTGGDEPFVPLFFHDKLRTLQAGASVEVRQVGEFELLLHSSSRVVSRGTATLRLQELGEASVHLVVPALTHLRLLVSARKHRIDLPDGSWLELDPALHDQATYDLVLERAVEPACHGGRATITNFGTVPVVWHHHAGVASLAPGEQVTFFLQPPAQFVGAPLVTEQVAAKPDGAALACSSGGAGEVRWSGARFTLPAGASVRLDPLQGDLVPPPPKPLPVNPEPQPSTDAGK